MLALPEQVWRGRWRDEQEGRRQEAKVHRRVWACLLKGEHSSHVHLDV